MTSETSSEEFISISESEQGRSFWMENTRDYVLGSPLNGLKIDPPFNEYFLVDLDGDKVDQLKSFPQVRGRTRVHVIHGDCNKVLLEDVFPQVRYEDYRRGLCLLDPYGLHLDWEVMRKRFPRPAS